MTNKEIFTIDEVKDLMQIALRAEQYEVTRYEFPDGTLNGLDEGEAVTFIEKAIEEKIKEREDLISMSDEDISNQAEERYPSRPYWIGSGEASRLWDPSHAEREAYKKGMKDYRDKTINLLKK